MMKYFQSLFMALSTVLFLFQSGWGQANDEKIMTMDQYNEISIQSQIQLATSKQQLETTKAEIEFLKTEMTKKDLENSQVWQEIYALIESDEVGVKDFKEIVELLEKELDSFDEMPDVQKKELQKSLNKRIVELQKSKISALSQVHYKLAELEKKMVLINLGMQ